MSDEIREVYMCDVCKQLYDTKELCQKCVESHKPYAKVQLKYIDDNYMIDVRPFKPDGYHKIFNDKVRVLENIIYPTFEIECKNNADDIKEAKRLVLCYLRMMLTQLHYFIYRQATEKILKEAKDDSDGK